LSIGPGKTEDFNVNNDYPNPYISQNDKFTTKLISSVTQNVKINIYNILGQTILNKSLLLLESEEKSFEWNLKNRHGKKVSSGIYFIEIKGEKKRQVEKVTVLN
ncbi:T9SS type A sorting domain-containing protein, partial [Candidatus Marinimicrobia bacterium]|nr:T9SS type A sorting domain-containing protein [Candidatus Neomarinimicrobiota bacterium]